MKDKIILLAKPFFGAKVYMKGFSLTNGFKYKVTTNSVVAEQVSNEMALRLIQIFHSEGRYKSASIESASTKDKFSKEIKTTVKDKKK